MKGLDNMNRLRKEMHLPALMLADNDNQPTSDKPTAKPLQVIDPTTWEGVPVKHREWFVPDLIPSRTVTLLSGDGGSGKSQLALQLTAAASLRTDWLGLPVMPGPVLYYSAEDEADELHHRLDRILAREGKRFADLTGVRLIPMVDRDAVLALPNMHGQIATTPVFKQLAEECATLRPKLIVIDTSADAFGGDEIKRSQVRQFVGVLRAVALQGDCAVLLLSHPSLTGIASGTGLSGSTAWNNSVRSRLYLTKEGSGARCLRVQKSNHGPEDGEIALHWHDGVFVLDSGPDAVGDNLVNATTDKLFMDLLAMFTEQGQDLSPKPSSTYAPTVMARDPKAKGVHKRKLESAMQRLILAKRVQIVTEGPPSKPRKRLVVVAAGGGGA
jgi:hypothetical protein